MIEKKIVEDNNGEDANINLFDVKDTSIGIDIT